jgi:hypothetical protein
LADAGVFARKVRHFVALLPFRLDSPDFFYPNTSQKPRKPHFENLFFKKREKNLVDSKIILTFAAGLLF